MADLSGDRPPLLAAPLFHAAGGAALLLAWRLTGMPYPGSLGLLVPLAWILTGLLSWRERVSPFSAALLGLFLASSVIWRTDPVVSLLAMALAAGGLMPGLLAVARGKPGPVPAVLPLLPLAILLTPFSGDEPIHATLTERLVAPGAGEFGNISHQIGDPTPGVTHHQYYYPALMVPGYPLGVPGVRAVNALMAMAAGFLFLLLLRKERLEERRLAVFLALAAIPGFGILGVVYPGWAALLVFIAGLLLRERKGGLVILLLVSVALASIKFRFLGLGVGLLLVRFLETGGRRKWAILLGTVGLVAGVLLLDRFLLDGRYFWIRYGNSEFLRALVANVVYRGHEVALAVLSSLVDAEGGLVWKAPWVLLGLAGIPALARRHGRLFLWLLVPTLVYCLTLFVWVPTDWHGMPTPHGRMLLPVVPLLAAAAAMRSREPGGRLLVGLSLAVTALCLVAPGLRFNDADGTDVIATALLGPLSPVHGALPSMVRPELLPFLAWSLAAALAVWLLATGRRGTGALLVASAIVLGSVHAGTSHEWEAEDLTYDLREHCRLYPKNTDPLFRKFWLGSRELMLYLSEDIDRVTLPLPPGEGDSSTVRLELISMFVREIPGIRVSCATGTDSLRLASELIFPPQWLEFIMGRFPDLDRSVENFRMLELEFGFPAWPPGDTLVIEPLTDSTGGIQNQGIYLDRIVLEP